MDKIPTRHNSMFGDEWSIKNTDLSPERLRALAPNEFFRNSPLLQSILDSAPGWGLSPSLYWLVIMIKEFPNWDLRISNIQTCQFVRVSCLEEICAWDPDPPSILMLLWSSIRMLTFSTVMVGRSEVIAGAEGRSHGWWELHDWYSVVCLTASLSQCLSQSEPSRQSDM